MRITDIRSRFASQECYSVYADCMFEPADEILALISEGKFIAYDYIPDLFASVI